MDGEVYSEIDGWKIPVHVEGGDAGPTDAQRRLLQEFREREKGLEGPIQMAIREYYRKNFSRLFEERRRLLKEMELPDQPEEWLQPYDELPEASWRLYIASLRIPAQPTADRLSLIFKPSWQERPLEVRISDWKIDSVEVETSGRRDWRLTTRSGP